MAALGPIEPSLLLSPNRLLLPHPILLVSIPGTLSELTSHKLLNRPTSFIGSIHDSRSHLQFFVHYPQSLTCTTPTSLCRYYSCVVLPSFFPYIILPTKSRFISSFGAIHL